MNEQTPRIILDEKALKVWCITKYLQISRTQFKPVEKHDVTSQLNDVLDQVYIKAQEHHRQGIYMTKRTKIVCLCGSTKFREEYRKANSDFTHQGWIVLTVGCLQGDPEWGMADKGMLDELHKRKIDIADLVFVINKDNYIGESTKSEIEYAELHNKHVGYLEAPSPDAIMTNLATEVEQ